MPAAHEARDDAPHPQQPGALYGLALWHHVQRASNEI